MSYRGAYYVYMLFCPSGEPCYVGKGKDGRYKRMDRPHNSHLQRIIDKAGGRLTSIKFAEYLPESEAHELEIALIAEFGRAGHGGILVNSTSGGEGMAGGIRSAATKAKISATKRAKATPQERFWAHVNKSGPTAPDMDTNCWPWTGHLNEDGYGKLNLRIHGYSNIAPRAAYQICTGPCPPLDVDLICGNHACVRPEHIAFVSRREKGARGMSVPARNARKTHCKRGHLFDEENTYRPASFRGRAPKRECRPCKAVHHKTYMAKHGDRVRARALAGYHARKNGKAA